MDEGGLDDKPRSLGSSQYETQQQVHSIEVQLNTVATKLDNLTKELKTHYSTKADIANAKLQMVFTWLGAGITLLTGLGLILARIFISS